MKIQKYKEFKTQKIQYKENLDLKNLRYQIIKMYRNYEISKI